MEENEGKEKKQKKKMQPKRWLGGFLGIFLAGLAGMYGTGDLGRSFFSVS